MASIKITQSEFKINGVRYFRASSEKVEICSYGKKEMPIFGSNFLVVKNKLPKEALGDAPIKVGEVVSVDWSKASKAEINPGLMACMKPCARARSHRWRGSSSARGGQSGIRLPRGLAGRRLPVRQDSEPGSSGAAR